MTATGRNVRGRHLGWPDRSGGSRRLQSVLVILVTAVALTACGYDDGTGTPDNPAPTVSSVNPSSVITGSGEFTLTVEGSGFIEMSTVRWNGAGRATTFISATQLSATIVAADVATAGEAMVTVSNPSPGGGESSATAVTIGPAAVAGVTVEPAERGLVPQQTLELLATPRDATGAPLVGRSTTWTSSDDDVATVSDAGVVEALAPGTVAITATIEGISGKADITVAPGGMVGPAGGTVAIEDDAVRLDFPAGAVSALTAITITEDASPPAHADLVAGTSWRLGPDGRAFGAPVTVHVRYDATELPGGGDPDDLVLHRWNGTEWVPLEEGAVDTGDMVVAGTTTTFSPFAILHVESNGGAPRFQSGEGYHRPRATSPRLSRRPPGHS